MLATYSERTNELLPHSSPLYSDRRYAALMSMGDGQQRLLPHLFFETVRRYRHRVCSYHRGLRADQWVALTWSDWESEVRATMSALRSYSVNPGDRVGILSATRREWLIADLAIMSIGATTVGVYDTSTAEQCAYILQHAGVKVLFVEDRDQLFLVRSIWDQLPELEHIIVFEPAPDLEGDRVSGYPEALETIRVGERTTSAPRDYPLAITADALAAIAYTSGTTGPPKGVMLTHRMVTATLHSVQRALPMHDSDLSIINLSLAHSLQRVGAWSALVRGATLVFGDRLDRFSAHMQQFRPTVQLSVPRTFEKFHSAILAELAEQDLKRRKLFEWATDVARQVRQASREGRRVPRHMRLQYAAAERTVLGPLRERFGGRIRYFICGAAPLAPELVEFFDALGMPILEGYGLTETCAPATVNTESHARVGTVGRALDICELSIASDGEVLIRGENIMAGYYRDADATAEVLSVDGWLHTGDLGAIDDDGFLTITGRKKDIIITAGGKNVSPQNIEASFAREPLIQHAVVFGDRQKFLVALFDIAPDALERLVKRFGLEDLSDAEQREHPQVAAELQLVVDRVNRSLARFESIKYFAITPKPLSVADGTLTPTFKVRRTAVQAEYSLVVESLFQTRRNRQQSLW